MSYETRVWSAIGALATVVVTACGDPHGSDTDPGVGDCFCDDGDPCTEDVCRPDLGRCVFVPRDAQNACRTDLHCDDGNTCTIDTCAVDECSLQRCRHDVAPECRQCVDDIDCQDGDGCTLDVCRFTAGTVDGTGFCEASPLEGCDPRCDFEYEAPASASSRVVGRVAASGCEAEGCPCTANPTLVNADLGIDVTVHAADATCSPGRCTESSVDWRCEPLRWNQRYIAWGALNATELALEGWCLVGTSYAMAEGIYDGTVELTDRRKVDFSADIQDGFVTLVPATCEGTCELSVSDGARAIFSEEGQRLAIDFFGLISPDGAPAFGSVRLFRAPDGLVGTFLIEGQERGRVTLRLR